MPNAERVPRKPTWRAFSKVCTAASNALDGFKAHTELIAWIWYCVSTSWPGAPAVPAAACKAAARSRSPGLCGPARACWNG
ncbi:hypothetical protein G6F35_019176 [Rhizopus arrhizus]|nr:hypothetical protein G6F35_019176 [Rhizopus arrhizus]